MNEIARITKPPLTATVAKDKKKKQANEESAEGEISESKALKQAE